MSRLMDLQLTSIWWIGEYSFVNKSLAHKVWMFVLTRIFVSVCLCVYVFVCVFLLLYLGVQAYVRLRMNMRLFWHGDHEDGAHRAMWASARVYVCLPVGAREGEREREGEKGAICKIESGCVAGTILRTRGSSPQRDLRAC